VEDARLKRWRPVLRRAMMKVRPEYFTWTPQERERYGARLPEDDHNALYKALRPDFAARFGATEVDRSPHFTSYQREWADTLLPLKGVGEDYFRLECSIPEDKSILEFPRLSDFDEAQHRVREALNQEDDPRYVAKSYRGSLWMTCAALYIEDEFTRAVLSMTDGYIRACLSEAAQKTFEALIPHQYVPANDHSQQEELKWEVDAGGLEGQLAELQQRVWEYEKARYTALSVPLGGRGVYLVDESSFAGSQLHFVFESPATLQAVRFRSFLRDTRALQRPLEELHARVHSETDALRAYAEEQHAEILRTYDPTIARIYSYPKVIVFDVGEGDVQIRAVIRMPRSSSGSAE